MFFTFFYLLWSLWCLFSIIHCLALSWWNQIAEIFADDIFTVLIHNGYCELISSTINLHDLSAHDIKSSSLWNFILFTIIMCLLLLKLVFLIIIEWVLFFVEFVFHVNLKVSFLNQILVFLSALLNHIIFCILFQLKFYFIYYALQE